MKRMLFGLLVVLAGTILLAVVGGIVFSLLDKNGSLRLTAEFEDEVAACLTVFGLVFAKASGDRRRHATDQTLTTRGA